MLKMAVFSYKKFFVSTILFFYVTNVDAVQRFAEFPTYTEVNPGQDALLKCRISDKKGICSWQKDNKPVGIYRGKYEWANEDSPTGGDCSLWVRGATLQLDDGQWQCQVTASNYDVQDALSSPPAALAVRVPPQTPRILFNGSHVMPGQNITVPAGTRATVVCEARYGNPPAYIEWYLEKERLTAWSQTNASEVERPRVWAARSVLELGASRSAHGRQLACRAHHPSYPAPYYKDSYTMLDVTYAPVVTIGGAEPSVLSRLEEGSSALTLECKADGNPSPYVWWTKDGQVWPTSGPRLTLVPVYKNNSGIYGCQARNSLGTSDSAKIEIDIKYPPKVVWVGPDPVVEANLFSKVTLECKAEGNPPPHYKWFHNPSPSIHSQIVPDGDYPVSSSAILELHNVTYSQHGRYTCRAYNNIADKELSHESEPITLNVLGPPLGAESSSAHAWRGGEARIHATVCADPAPLTAVWLWGSLRIEVPGAIGRYRALEPTGMAGCYRYTLALSSAAADDARVYVLHVENERGFSEHAVHLTVHETAAVAPLIAAGLVLAALLLLALCLALRCRHKRESVQYKTDELDSEKTVLPADAVYQHPPPARPAASPPSAYGDFGSVAGVAGPGAPGGAGGAGGAGSGVRGAGGGGGGARYSPAALQAALSSLEREAKDNVYAALDPHVQYDITINKEGEPPKYLTLSKPLTHQRTHAFHPQQFNREINNNFSSFKSGHNKTRKTYQENYNTVADKRNICKYNNDIEYTRDPYFGIDRNDNEETNRNYDVKFQTAIYDRNNPTRKSDVRASNRSRRSERRSKTNNFDINSKRFDEIDDGVNNNKGIDEYIPRPGKVRELASKFNRYSGTLSQSFRRSKRPKPLQSYGNQAYLDHIFPDAVEI